MTRPRNRICVRCGSKFKSHRNDRFCHLCTVTKLAEGKKRESVPALSVNEIERMIDEADRKTWNLPKEWRHDANDSLPPR